MTSRKNIAAAMVCLCLAGCFKAGRKAPLVEEPNVRLVARYNEDVNMRLQGHQKRLIQQIEKVSILKAELRKYQEFEKSYLKALETKCDGSHDNNLANLHGEVVEWRTTIIDGLNNAALDITDLLASLQSEKLSMDATERAVGRPVIAVENRGIALSLTRLSMDLREEISKISMAPVPAPECAEEKAMAAKTSQQEEPFAEFNYVRRVKPTGRMIETELEPELIPREAITNGNGILVGKRRYDSSLDDRSENGKVPEGNALPKENTEEDIYDDGKEGKMSKTKEEEIFGNRL